MELLLRITCLPGIQIEQGALYAIYSPTTERKGAEATRKQTEAAENTGSEQGRAAPRA